MALNGTTMGDPPTGLTKVPNRMVITEEDTDDTANVVAPRATPPTGRTTRHAFPETP